MQHFYLGCNSYSLGKSFRMEVQRGLQIWLVISFCSHFLVRLALYRLNIRFKAQKPTNDTGGTDLSIYGVMDWTQIGHLVLSVAVDGFFVDQIDFPVLLNTSEVVGGWGQETNFLFYKIPANVSTPGTHTVLVDVVECINQTFTFDYITYTSPSFTFEAIPSTPSGSNTKSRIGPIIGGAVGGLIFILLVALFLDCVRRRKRQVRTHFGKSSNGTRFGLRPLTRN